MATLTVEGMCSHYDQSDGGCNHPCLTPPIQMKTDSQPGPDSASLAFFTLRREWYCTVGGKKGTIGGNIAMAQKQCSGYIRGRNRTQKI